METERRIDRDASTDADISPYPLLAEAQARRFRHPRFELRCVGCGYEAVSPHLIRCPRCGDEAWDFAAWRPFHR